MLPQMKNILFLSLALLFSLATATAQLTINGTITAPDGSVPALAHVFLTPLSDASPNKPSLETTNGKFRLVVPKSGYYKLWITSPNAECVEIPMILTERDKSVKLDVTLTSIKLKSPLTSANILINRKREAMTPEPDGTFSFTTTATADTLAYQLVNVDFNNYRSHNGTHSDYFVPDGGGDYYSVLRTKPGEPIKIVFNPKQMPQSPEHALAKVKWDKAHAFLSKLFELNQKFDIDRFNAMRAYAAAKDANPALETFSYDHSALKRELESVRDNASERLEVRQLAALLAFELPPYQKTKADVQSLLALVPASSPLWGINPYALNEISHLLSENQPTFDSAIQVLNEFKEKNPDRRVQCLALTRLAGFARSNKDKEKQRAIYNELKANYADLQEAKYAMMEYNPDKAIQVGNPAPDFEIKLLSGESVSRTSMLGKYYLIDFWAVWCGPCVAEMPKLHEAYEKHKGKKGFNVLSLSFDQSPDDIAKFRATKFSMPWLHAFVENGFNNDLSKRFEVMGIPKPILVDDKGNIVAVEVELRGNNLDKTLAKHLDESKN